MRYARGEQGDRSTTGPQNAGSADEAAGTVPHPFTGRLIDGAAAADWLVAAIAGLGCNVALCSAYLRAQALETLLAGRAAGLGGRVLVRWQLADLLAGASDLQAFQVAKAAGLQLLIRLDFHGKVFCVPGRGILVGSANATLSGLGLRSQSNEEVCTLVPAAPENLAHIEHLFAGAVLMDEQLFAEISEAVQAASRLEGSAGSADWPASLLSKLQASPAVHHLLASECLWSAPQLTSGGSIKLLDVHDRQLLGLSQSTVTLGDATHRLQQTKIFRWLRQFLQRAGVPQFFGALSGALHDSLLDDPTPYRHEVKVMLQHLLAWCELLPAAGVIVDRPQYSQRVRLHDTFGSMTEREALAIPQPRTSNSRSGRFDPRSRGRRGGQG